MKSQDDKYKHEIKKIMSHLDYIEQQIAVHKKKLMANISQGDTNQDNKLNFDESKSTDEFNALNTHQIDIILRFWIRERTTLYHINQNITKLQKEITKENTLSLDDKDKYITQKIVNILSTYDTDKDGKLSVDEFNKFITEVIFNDTKINYSKESYNPYSNEDGVIDKNECMRFLGDWIDSEYYNHCIYNINDLVEVVLKY